MYGDINNTTTQQPKNAPPPGKRSSPARTLLDVDCKGGRIRPPEVFIDVDVVLVLAVDVATLRLCGCLHPPLVLPSPQLALVVLGLRVEG